MIKQLTILSNIIIINKSKTSLDGLNDILSPDNLYIKVKPYTELEDDELSNEVWTESPCLLIDAYYFNDTIMKNYR